MQPPTLRIVAQTTIIRTLVCSPGDCTRQRLLIELFRTTEGSCLSEEVLTLIIEQFPQWLTDELLSVLAPQYMKRLKLKGCSLVTCDGLIKTIVRCSHLNQLDFSGCANLLHPTVFCCLKDFAPHMTHLMFEDCEVMTDDTVQIILMCCPKLEHLNISSCKNITDKAFTFTSSSDTNRLSQCAQLAGRNLSCVDISGCQSLTSTAVRNLVALCGPTLTSINIAWTGVGCIALLYLAGLSLEAAVQFVQEADSSCLGLLGTKDISTTQDTGAASSTSIEGSELLCTENTSSHSNGESNGGPSNLSDFQNKLKQDHFSEVNEDQTLYGQTSEQDLSEAKVETGVSLHHNCSDSSTSLVTCSHEDAKIKLCENPSCEISHREQGDGHLGNSKTLQNQNSNEYVGNSLQSKHSEHTSEHSEHTCTSNSNDKFASTSNISLLPQPIKHDTPEPPRNSSLDEKWMLAWQQIDNHEACVDNDELFDSVWNDEPIGVDSVSSAFGHGISCLTSALNDLELYDTDDDDDDLGTLTSKEFPQTEVDSYSMDKVVSLKDNDDNGHHLVTAKENLQCCKILGDGDLTSETDKLEDNMTKAQLPSPPREDDISPHGLPSQDDSVSDNSLATKDRVTFHVSTNQNKHLDDENCNIQTSTSNDKQDSSSTLRDGENIMGYHGENDKQDSPSTLCDGENILGYHGDEEVSLDEADEILAEILDVHELTSYDSYSPLHGFKDALACLTNAMVDLINADDDDDDDSQDDDDDLKNNDEKISLKVTQADYEDALDNGGGDDDNFDDDDDDSTNGETLVEGQHCYHDNHDSIEPSTCCHSDHEPSNQIQSQDNDGLCPQCYQSNNVTFDSESNENVEVCKVGSLNAITMEEVNLVLLPMEQEDESGESVSASNNMSGLHKGDDTATHDSDLVDTCNNDSLDKKPSLDPPTNTTVDTKPSSESLSKISENMTHKPGLHTIDISNIYFHSKPLGVACLKIFTMMNKTLQSFATSWTELDDDTLIGIIKNEPELRSLSLTDCEKITDRSLMSLPVYCPRLEKIDLKGVPFITDMGVVPMLSLSCLQTLSIAETSVSDISLFSVAEKCGDKLRDLDLSWCEDVTDKGLSAMATSCTGLYSLGLRQCAASFVTMETLSRYCHGLTSLNFAGLHQLTDQMVATMATNMPNLTVVDMSWNSGLTSIGVGALMLNCTRLEEVLLNGLKALTSKPFLPIIGDLPRWRTKQEVMLRRKLKRQQSGGPAETLIKSCPMEMAIGLGEDLPFRSTTYCAVLRHLELVYSDKVHDDHLCQIVAVCRGTLSITDYYSRLIEPMWIFLR